MSRDLVIRIVIRGRVQGVGFRYWTAGLARDLGLGGWVRNRRDGSVEAVFRGPAETVGRMIEACRGGPPSARVETVEEHSVAPDEAEEGNFEQRGTL
ncbi:acylphosphatase [Enterovirga sp.]|uniref:acylphosphatase n=1 Tax=Enterovirga sp. TaxID=2026350 RepID=UPI002D1C51AD|nr:acylphosphatase [Enterovirga sp.]HMO30255.1 acylphosphatase [Enterovirga sp.]